VPSLSGLGLIFPEKTVTQSKRETVKEC